MQDVLNDTHLLHTYIAAELYGVSIMIAGFAKSLALALHSYKSCTQT